MFFFVDMLPPQSPIMAVEMNQTDSSIETKFTERAKSDGWSDSQAYWIGKLGAVAMQEHADNSPEAVNKAYEQARKQLAVGYFDNAMKEGKSRLVAFLTVVDLEKQVGQRGGDPAPAYSDDALKAAYVMLAQAAERGASSADQLEIAFSSLRGQAAPTK